eukprot:CAMPEP_0175119358 /NCGR_PEP_ID=MMETSP0087-20121206/13_1 /TAXON_ID=136419 /ORGANISM="Unknown Unknown, Strain D1" /LENGTH=141 /DNA_ID=CAMNT_0016400669 /DNA_START=376 /DNA_END=801 /DNA_ORIENTATION=-
MLRRAGLSDWVTTSHDQYISKAVSFVRACFADRGYWLSAVRKLAALDLEDLFYSDKGAEVAALRYLHSYHRVLRNKAVINLGTKRDRDTGEVDVFEAELPPPSSPVGGRFVSLANSSTPTHQDVGDEHTKANSEQVHHHEL